MKNLEHAGEALPEGWSGMVFDGHPCVSKYILEGQKKLIEHTSEDQRDVHVRAL